MQIQIMCIVTIIVLTWAIRFFITSTSYENHIIRDRDIPSTHLVPMTYDEYIKFKAISPERWSWRRDTVYWSDSTYNRLYYEAGPSEYTTPYQVFFTSKKDYLKALKLKRRDNKAKEMLAQQGQTTEMLKAKEDMLKFIQADITKLLQLSQDEIQEAKNIVESLRSF